MWNSKKDILKAVAGLSDRLVRIEEYLQETKDFFSSESMESTLDSIHDKVNGLIKDKDRLRAVFLAEKTLDKFEDYMKNVDKLNGMINELKGCASMARGAVADRKALGDELNDVMKDMNEYIENLASENSKKIDSMGKLMRKIAVKLQVCEKKSPKKRKVKKPTPQPA